MADDEYVTVLKRMYSGGTLAAADLAKAIADHRNANWARRSTKFLVCFGAISAAASAMAAFLSYQALVANQRAYITYDGVNTWKDVTPTLRYSINPKITNSGNTPTKDLRVKVNCWLDPESDSEPYDKFRSQGIAWQNGFYGPKVTLQAIECHYTAEQVQAIKDGRLHSYIAAEITYQDTVSLLSRNHVTQFVLEFMISSFDEKGNGLIGGVAQRGKHNCADEGCPLDDGSPRK